MKEGYGQIIFYADSIYERILTLSFTLGNHVVICFVCHRNVGRIL